MFKIEQGLPVDTTGPGALSYRLHEFLNNKALHWSDEEPTLTKNDAHSCSVEERFGPTSWEVMVFSGEVLCVFQLTEGFSVTGNLEEAARR